MEPSLQIIELTEVTPFHVAFITWNHMEPHGTNWGTVPCRVPSEYDWKRHMARLKSIVYNGGSMCSMCAM